MFACEQEGVSPDLMCVAKGMTGGYLPLAATLATEAVYEAFLGEHHEYRTFFHGHTYTGNPLACAAALATLDVFESERTLERLAPKIELLGELLDEQVAPLPTVARGAPPRLHDRHRARAFPVEARMGHQVTLAARRRGAIVRPLGDVVVLMPPLSITADELTRLVGDRSSSSTASHSPNVGEPRRRSTTTSSTRPRATRTSLPWPGCVWKWMPRRVPRREREWLSCTKSPATPCASHASARHVSMKNPRSSPKTGGASSTRPSRRVGKRSIGPPA